MKRTCIYWLLLSLASMSPVHAGEWEATFAKATQTREDRLAAQVEQLRETVENLAAAVERKTQNAKPPAPGYRRYRVRVAVPCPTCPGGYSYYYKYIWVPAPQVARKEVVRRPAPKAASPVYYSQYGGYARWTWPGDLRRHIQGAPHNVRASWANTASPQQLIGYHDGWHNQNGAR